MPYPTFTQAQYDALVAAIAEGAHRVKYEDREVEYRSLADMNRIRLLMEKSLGLTPATPNRKVMAHSKGLGATPTPSSPWETT